MQIYKTASTLQRTHFSQVRSFLRGYTGLPQVNGFLINPGIQKAETPEKTQEVIVFDASSFTSVQDTVILGSKVVALQKPVELAKPVVPSQPVVVPAPILLPKVQKPETVQTAVEVKAVEPLKPAFPREIKPTKTHASIWKKAVTVGSIMAVVAAFVVAGTIFLPNIYYKIFPSDALPVIAESEGTPLGGSFTETTEPTRYEPPFDPNLPGGDWISIPRIGVRTELRKTEHETEALDKGVWWVPEFGNPGDLENPMIVAAHRFGWTWWWNTLADPNDPSATYALRNSFYYLPDTEPGDTVEVISGQRKYIYEIYSGEENNEITDYSADLILYTCKFLNSPIRHVRYARLINPEKDSQALSLN